MFIGLTLLLCGADPVAAAAPHYAAELIFPLHSAHNPAPGIAACPNGDLFATWYRGSGERSADDVAVYGAWRKKGSTTWDDPILLADTPGLPDCNTALFTDTANRLWLFYPTILANTWESCLTNFKISSRYSAPGPPSWDREGIIFLKPADFSSDGNALLDQHLKNLPTEISPERKARLGELRRKLGDKLFQRLGWQPPCKPT